MLTCNRLLPPVTKTLANKLGLKSTSHMLIELATICAAPSIELEEAPRTLDVLKRCSTDRIRSIPNSLTYPLANEYGIYEINDYIKIKITSKQCIKLKNVILTLF